MKRTRTRGRPFSGVQVEQNAEIRERSDTQIENDARTGVCVTRIEEVEGF